MEQFVVDFRSIPYNLRNPKSVLNINADWIPERIINLSFGAERIPDHALEKIGAERIWNHDFHVTLGAERISDL